MNVLILCGSPHKNGTTNALAEALIAGIDGTKHEIEKIFIAEKNIAPCLGCDACRKNGGICVQKDDMAGLLQSIQKADLIVFASPLYYFGFTAQLKTVIDRFYAVNAALRAQTEKKAILLTAGGGSEQWIMDGILASYHTMLRYLHWQDVGTVCACGCHTKEQLPQTDYPNEAKRLGETL